MTEYRPERLVGGLTFPEAPRWHEGRLYFSDVPARVVMAVDFRGKPALIATIPQRPSGLGFLTDNRLLVASMRDRQLYRLDADALRLHADLTDVAGGDIKDMVVDGEGRAYVANFGSDPNAGEPGRPARLVMVTEAGAVRVVGDELQLPSGMAITPDGRSLIVAESVARQLTAFDIEPDGSLSGRRLFAALSDATPRGICLDESGAVWVASPATEEFLRVREGGAIADCIPTPGRWAVACILGGLARRTLFLLTAQTTREDLARGRSRGFIDILEVQTPGAGWP